MTKEVTLRLEREEENEEQRAGEEPRGSARKIGEVCGPDAGQALEMHFFRNVTSSR